VATTRAIRISETFSGGFSTSSSSFTQTSGEGVDFNGSRSLSLQNTATKSEVIAHTFIDSDSFSSNFKLEANGIYPASRCSIKFRGLNLTQTTSITGGGSGVSFTIPIFTFNSSQGGGSTQSFNNQTGTGHTASLNNAHITGSDATLFTSAGTNDMNSMSCRFQIDTSNNNSNGLHSVVLQMQNPTLSATVDRIWEASDIVINGSDSDHTLPPFASAFTLAGTGALLKDPGPVSVNTAFTLAEASECFNFGEADLSSSFTMSVSPTLLFKPTLALASTFELEASTDNFVRMDAVNVSSAFTVAVTPTFKLGTALAVTSTATLTESNKVIFDVEGDYTWNQFSNNPFIVSGYVKGGYTNDAEYEWNDLTTDTWNNWTYGTWIGDEATWDQWPGNTWNREFVFASVFTMADVDHLHVKFAESALTSAFALSDTAAFMKLGASSMSSAFTFTATAQGLIDIPSTNLSSAFTLAVSDVDFIDNLEPLTLSSAFTLTATASHKQDTTQTIGSAFTFALSTAFVKYDITDTAPSAFATDFVANIKYAPTVPTFNALASALSVGKLLVQADPYNIITVDAETRTIVIPTENRITAIMEENRLNTIINENRLTKIMQETRTHKLKIPSITDRFSTPRVRSET